VTAKTPPAGIPARTHDKADMLHQFGQCASVIRDLLYEHRPLDEEEILFVDKRLLIHELS
jgi:hypothetical protein